MSYITFTDNHLFQLKCSFNPKPDGDSQFATLSDQPQFALIVGVSHMDLRQAVGNNLQTDESVSQFVSSNGRLYLKEMKHSGNFGDHVTLKAVTTSYKVQILVFSTLKTVILISGEVAASFDPTILTVFVGHFAEDKGEHCQFGTSS